MSHLRSNFNGVSVPIGTDGSSHNTINNNITISNDKTEKSGVEEVSDGIYVVYPNKERDIKDAEARLEEIKKVQPDNEKVIEALNLIIEMYHSNPLYINKWVIADSQILAKIIGVLSNAERVDITLSDPSCECGGCCGSSEKTIASIDTIYVVRGEDVKEFRYSYPEAKKILDNAHVSTKLVALESV